MSRFEGEGIGPNLLQTNVSFLKRNEYPQFGLSVSVKPTSGSSEPSIRALTEANTRS